jgi:Tat protein translocase TatC
MTLTEHLEDLRWCILKSILAVVLASGLSYFYADAIFDFVVAPLRQNLPPGQNLIGTSVTEAFFVEIKVALAAGVLFSCPVIFYQIWRFVAPGLSGREKKWVLPFVLCATFFFVSGAAFCYRFVLPVAFKYFIEQYQSMGVSPAIRIGEYFTFFFRMVLAFRIARLHVFSCARRYLGLPFHAAVVPLRAGAYFCDRSDFDADARCHQSKSSRDTDAASLHSQHRHRLRLAQTRRTK